MADSKNEPRDRRRRGRASSPRRSSGRKSERTAQADAELARELALVIAGAALDKKALAIEILDVVGKVDYADFLVLMTGRSHRHVDALAQGIEEACAKRKKRPLS